MAERETPATREYHTRNVWPNPVEQIPGEANSGRSAILSTDRDLQTGPPPDRIDRSVKASIFGKVGPNDASLRDTGMAYIGAVPIVRSAPLPLPYKAIDDNAFVPALFVGNPTRE